MGHGKSKGVANRSCPSWRRDPTATGEGSPTVGMGCPPAGMGCSPCLTCPLFCGDTIGKQGVQRISWQNLGKEMSVGRT